MQKIKKILGSAIASAAIFAGFAVGFPGIAAADHCSTDPNDDTCHTTNCDPCDLDGGCWDACECDPNGSQCARPCQDDPCFSPSCEGYDACECDDICDPMCGDGNCDLDETPLSCPADCTEACGNGTCDEGEDYETCPADCDDPCEDEDPCTEGECYDFDECCALEPCADFSCPGYCGDPFCDTDYCCQQDPEAEGCDMCGNGTCDEGEDYESCPEDCDDPCEGEDPCTEGECYDFDECCALESCSDQECPGYCDESQAGGVCDQDFCCESEGNCCGGEPYPDDGASYTCCADNWEDSDTGECCPDEQWCDNDNGNHCIGRNICFADQCVEDGEYECAVAVGHSCTVGRDYQCADYCDSHPDDPCCVDPDSCDGGAVCGDGICAVSADECLACPGDCTSTVCTGACVDPCSDPECTNYPGKDVCDCGNDVCDSGECEACPGDCGGTNELYCGDGVCASGETGVNCPSDCPAGNPGSFYGCIDSNACNYDADASISNGSCVYPGCMDVESPNYDPEATCPGSCDSGGGVCALSGSFTSFASCGDGNLDRTYSGIAECSAAVGESGCPCDEAAIAAFAAYGTGSLCGASAGVVSVGGSGHYSFRYVVEETCPAGQVRVDGGCAASCPQGDGDADGLCDCSGSEVCGRCDPCTDINDPSISSDAARAAAGLREPNAVGECCENGVCCEQPGYVYVIADRVCRPVLDMCQNIVGDQKTVPDGMSRVQIDENTWYCQCGDGFKECGETCIPDNQCCDPDNFQYCLNRRECIPKTECCDPTHVACPTCRPAAECVDMCLGQATGGEYCTEVASENGITNSPWAAVYPTDLALGGFFASSTSNKSFVQVKEEQAAARNDGDPATVEMPLVGRVVTLAGGGSCTAQICDHGQECALYVRAGGRTSATCVDTICDVCDPESVCFSEEACGCNPLVDPVSCCEADPGKPGYNPECVLPPRGVAIEVLPNLINTSGDGGTCFVLWASQGMASTTVVGEGMDAGPNLDLRHLSAGIATVSGVKTSTLFKIIGQGVDGQTYEATDLCAANPSIGEF